jgi:hypothetical protein
MFVSLSNDEYAVVSKLAREQSPRQLTEQFAATLIREALVAR